MHTDSQAPASEPERCVRCVVLEEGSLIRSLDKRFEIQRGYLFSTILRHKDVSFGNAEPLLGLLGKGFKLAKETDQRKGR
jgi:hypothetical protein